MFTYVIVLGVLVVFIAVALLVRRELGVVAALRSELQNERTVSAELREKAGQFQGQLTVLEKAAVLNAGDLLAADNRINELTREHAEAKSGLENANVRINDLAEQLVQRVDEVRTLGDRLSALQVQQAKSEAALESATQLKADASAFFNEAEIRLSRTAVQALSEKGQELQAQSRSDLSLLLTPFAERITAFQARAEQLYGDEAAQRLNLAGVVQQMVTNQQRVAEDYTSFARAMKGNPKARGDWGELVLEGVLQCAGLEKGANYLSQESTTDPDTGERVKPDIIIKFPDSRHVVVDSKLNLLAWHDAMNCEDEDPEGYKEAMGRHVEAVRAHVKELSEKNYPKAVGSSALEGSIAFFAIESALAGALRADPSLLPYALARGVMLASPNTLMAVLVVTERLWKRDKLTRTAKELSDAGGRVLDAVIRFLEDFEAVGKKLGDASQAYEAARHSLQTSHGVIPRTQKLVGLGVKGKRSLPEQLELDEVPDTLTTPQLTQFAEEDAVGSLPEGVVDQVGAADVPF